jgi:hypothetical protein
MLELLSLNIIFCGATREMRTTFIEMRLFNDDSQRQDTSFILKGKEWGVNRIERERERKRERQTDRERERKRKKEKERERKRKKEKERERQRERNKEREIEERERKKCSALVKKGCGVGYKLDSWSCIYEGPEMDFIKMNIKLIPRI